MRTQQIFQLLLKLLLIVCMSVLAVSLFSCKSKKKAVEKRAKKVSEIVQKDIKQSTETQLDVSVMEVSEKQEVRIDPIENTKPITVIFPNNDTVQVANGKISIGSEKTIIKTTDKTQTRTRTKDKTATKKQTQTQQKIKNKDVKGGFPWWLVILVGVIFLIWKYGRKFL